MNDIELLKLASVMSAYFPSFHPANKEIWLESWKLVFADYPYEVVSKALGMYVTKNTSGFAPTPGQIIDYIPKNEATEQQVWSIVRKALENGIYGSEEEFEKLPEPIQKAVGSAQSLKAWASTDNAQIEGVVQSQFLRSYREVKKDYENRGETLCLGIENKSTKYLIAKE